RQVVLPVRRFGAEEFAGAGGPLLLAGNTMHTDLSPEAAAGAAFGWLLACLAQDRGFPVPEGGAARLVDALVARLAARGGQVRCASRVQRILVKDGTAIGVVTADGTELDARRAVLADVDALTLYRDLVGEEHLPSSVVSDLRRFQY